MEACSGAPFLRNSAKTEKKYRGQRRRIATLISLGLITILGAVALMNLESPRGFTGGPTELTGKRGEGKNLSLVRTVPANPPGGSLPSPTVAGVCASPADLEALSARHLMIPVAGIEAGQLRDSFYDARSEGRIHKALDIMAPRDTPVIAADDGLVMKLHQSDRGGVMLYQADPSSRYVYYYGHLTRYADGISEGKVVKRGEVIAFVGDTGNAGPGNCHLHFGISRVTNGRWSGGEPINPYPLLTGQSGWSSTEAGE